jgi:hypothetical protein
MGWDEAMLRNVLAKRIQANPRHREGIQGEQFSLGKREEPTEPLGESERNERV